MIAMMGLLSPLVASADIVVNGSFGPNGDVGFVTSPPSLGITFGAAGQGSIFQMDGFVNATGHDFGGGSGVSADLANGSPTGLAYSFSASQPTAAQLLLSYSFTNTSGTALSGLQFLYFVDPDIGANFADETATTHGSIGTGFPNVTSFQVGDPSLSTIFTNLTNGTLSNVNELPSGTPGDVSMALGFNVGTLGVGQSTGFQVLLSDDGSHLGGFYISQQDPIFTGDTLTVSGLAVPEPASWISLTIGGAFPLAYALRRRARRQAWTRSQ
jgi:hypothetical protein